jgi:hypothetical protein
VNKEIVDRSCWYKKEKMEESEDIHIPFETIEAIPLTADVYKQFGNVIETKFNEKYVFFLQIV